MCEYEKWCEISYLKSVVFSVKIGKNSARNQSKTLIPQNKNQIFQIFLTYFPKTSYERRATRNCYIFVSNVQVALIIEALALEFTLDVSSLAFLSGASGKKKPNIEDPPSFGGLRAYPDNRGQLTKLTNVADPPSYGGNHEL